MTPVGWALLALLVWLVGGPLVFAAWMWLAVRRDPVDPMGGPAECWVCGTPEAPVRVEHALLHLRLAHNPRRPTGPEDDNEWMRSLR